MREPPQDNDAPAFELDSLFNWMRFLTDPSLEYEKEGVAVHVYGELDDSFIVIEKRIFSTPMPLDQYVLLTGDAANSLMSLVRLLKEFQFDLGRLVAKLERLDYGIEGRARLERVDVGYNVIGHVPSADDEAPEEDDFVDEAVDERATDPAAPKRSLAEIARSLAPYDGRHGRPKKPPRGD